MIEWLLFAGFGYSLSRGVFAFLAWRDHRFLGYTLEHYWRD